MKLKSGEKYNHQSIKNDAQFGSSNKTIELLIFKKATKQANSVDDKLNSRPVE
jgi:hypothetical protein